MELGSLDAVKVHASNALVDIAAVGHGSVHVSQIIQVIMWQLGTTERV